MNKLFIPDKIKVGYNKREDTYTKQLGYIIYYDEKGELRKKKSWESWRDHSIAPSDFDNSPTEGFVLNRSGGGGRGWSSRSAFIRIYDPRGFEFEISPANLLFILAHQDCTRGKGLSGKYVYAWDKTDLVLLPTESEDYNASRSFTSLQGQSVKLRDLIPGASYKTKGDEVITFIGRLDFWHPREGYRKLNTKSRKNFVFYDGTTNFLPLNDAKKLATLHDAGPHPEYAELVTKFYNSKNGTPVKELFLKPFSVPIRDREYRDDTIFINAGEEFVQYRICRYYATKKIDMIIPQYIYFIQNQLIKSKYIEYNNSFRLNLTEEQAGELWVRLESGAEFKVEGLY